MKMSTADEQFAFIQTVLAQAGWSQTDLANRAGLDPSTLSRFLTKGRDGHALRQSTIQRIVSASGIEFGKIVPSNELAEGEVTPYDFTHSNSQTALMRNLLTGREDLVAWTLHSRAIENLGYRAGDILIVALNETPLIGDIVCAQIYDWTKGKAETVFRQYQPPALIAASSDQRLLKPYLLGDNALVIKGVVLHTLRSR
jgi:transcriptional regulator with XRE-family HTH domain